MKSGCVDFSIIIPTFNSEGVIRKAIESILCQSYEDFEILVQDGISSDGTERIVRSFNDNRIRIFVEKDDGIYDAMNKGLKYSSGQWLLFLGSDDALYDRRVLERIVKVRRQHPASKFIYGDVVTSANSIQRYENYSYSKLLEMSICHQSIIYHRSLFDDVQYDLKFKICADWDFNLKVFRNRNRPVYTNCPLVYFNLGGVSNNWRQHPEYLQYFANKKRSILRYRGWIYLVYHCLHHTVRRVKIRVDTLRRKLLKPFA